MKIKATLILTLAFFITSFAGIKEYLDNSVIVIENEAGDTSTDTRHIYFGGGYKIKTPTVNFQPFTVTPPSFKAGCGGIDITFGAFSYFEPEYLVDFLKATASQAPAFAFKTAIQTLCPQCSQLMDNLASLANAINGLNFNSCQLAQVVGGKVGDWFGSNLNRALYKGEAGPDWLKSFNEKTRDVTKFINEDMKNLLDELGCNSTNKGCFASFIYSNKLSLLEHLIEDAPYVGNDTQFINIVRAFIGDIARSSTDGDAKLKFFYIPPSVLGRLADSVINGIATGEGNCDRWRFDRAVDNQGRDITSTIIPICGYVDYQLENIIIKMSTRSKLNDDELKFLSMFNAPVYQLINTLSLQPGALTRLKPFLVKYLSMELTYDILSSVLSDYSSVLSRLLNNKEEKNLPVDEEFIRNIMTNIAFVLQETQDLVVKEQKELKDKIGLYFDIQRLRGMLMASLSRHPIMGSRLYTKSLLGF